jgi:hypothetical protein
MEDVDAALVVVVVRHVLEEVRVVACALAKATAKGRRAIAKCILRNDQTSGVHWVECESRHGRKSHLIDLSNQRLLCTNASLLRRRNMNKGASLR